MKFKEWRKWNIRLGRELTLHARDQILRLNASIQFLWIVIIVKYGLTKHKPTLVNGAGILSAVSTITNHLKSCPLVGPAV